MVRAGRRSNRGVFILLLIAGCGPTVEEGDDFAQRYARAWCSATRTCDCTFPSHSTADECEAEYSFRFNAAIGDGLRVQESAFETLIEQLERDPCEPWAPTPLQPPDYVLRGSKGQGEACAFPYGLPVVSFNECAGDLQCTAEGRCDPKYQEYPSKAEGDPCWPVVKGSCWDDALFCSSRGVCERVQATIGAPCMAGGCGACHIEDPCETLLWCDGAVRDGQGVCAESVEAGDNCDPLDVVGCSSLEEDWLWCDPGTRTCTRAAEAMAPRVCVSAHKDALSGA